MTELNVQNMTCGHCVSAVTRAVKSIDPSAAVQVDLEKARVRVDGRAEVDRLIGALEEAGYPASRVTGEPAPAAQKGGCCGGCG